MTEKTTAALNLWKMTLEQAHDSILQGLMQGPAGHYQIGLTYNCIVARRLAVNRGYRTTREYFRRHVRVLSHAALTMYGAVAYRFPQAVCEKYGMASLGALLNYMRLASLWHVDAAEPGPTPIQLPRQRGLQLTKPFSDCTAEDLRDAVQARRAWPGQGMLEQNEEPLKRYLEVLQRHFGDHTRNPPHIDAHVHNRRAHLRIRHLRLSEMEQVTEALRLTLQPAGPVALGTPPPTALGAQPVGAASSFR
jgi:hypothetical protein